jgi:hypothetical protein
VRVLMGSKREREAAGRHFCGPFTSTAGDLAFEHLVGVFGL